MSDYRERIYERYASVFKNRTEQFDQQEAERWGRAYHTYFKGWFPAEKDAAIADLACGHGNLLHFFQSVGYHNLSGVDISKDQVKIAKQIVPEVQENNLLDYLNEHANSFDLLTGLDIIEHLKKDEVLDFLDGCYKALKPGGRLLLQTPNATSPFANIIRYGDFTHEVCFEENVLGQLLKLCGFSQVEAREMGPVWGGYSFKSSIRYILWRCIRMGFRLINTIETGSPGPQVWTRVFLITAIKEK